MCRARDERRFIFKVITHLNAFFTGGK